MDHLWLRRIAPCPPGSQPDARSFVLGQEVVEVGLQIGFHGVELVQQRIEVTTSVRLTRRQGLHRNPGSRLAGWLGRCRRGRQLFLDQFAQLRQRRQLGQAAQVEVIEKLPGDRKSTRLNSSHVRISYAVFCLKKKNEANADTPL